MPRLIQRFCLQLNDLIIWFPCKKHARGATFCYTNRACQSVWVVLSDAKDAPTQNGESPLAQLRWLSSLVRRYRCIHSKRRVSDGELAPFSGKGPVSACSSAANGKIICFCRNAKYVIRQHSRDVAAWDSSEVRYSYPSDHTGIERGLSSIADVLVQSSILCRQAT